MAVTITGPVNIHTLKAVLLRVVLPVVLGCLIYYSSNTYTANRFTAIVKNQLPDGLWAYALCCAMLIIWGGKVNFFWMIILAALFIGFETLQYWHILPGTGDVWDVATYFIFAATAFITNKYFFVNALNQKNETAL